MTTDEPTTTEPTPYSDLNKGVGSVLYAWQMQVDDAWNIIGMGTATGFALPMVTTSLPLAWEMFEVAQAHANKGACQVRLAMFTFSDVAAIVEPND